MYRLALVKGSFNAELTLPSQADCYRTLRKLQRKGSEVRYRILRFNGVGWESNEVL